MKEKEQEQIVIYESKGGRMQIDVRLQENTIWLTQAQMGILFDKNKRTISEHINNVFKERELKRKSTVRKSRTVQKEGDREIHRALQYFNLDVIISVGYRVKSKRGTQFRIWANKVLKDYLVQGYAVNEKRLQEKSQQLQELKKVIRLQERVLSEYPLETKISIRPLTVKTFI